MPALICLRIVRPQCRIETFVAANQTVLRIKRTLVSFGCIWYHHRYQQIWCTLFIQRPRLEAYTCPESYMQQTQAQAD
jgi:hypothetical protein